jgi:hypothetical protein
MWVPTVEDIQPARGQGGDIAMDSSRNMNLPGGAQPPLATRLASVECDIWGTDRDATETMINAVVSATYEAMTYGSFGLLSARWLLPEETLKDGEIYRLTFQFMIPIIRVVPGITTANIASIPITDVFAPIVTG